MDWFGVIGVAFGVFGVVYAGRFYWELRRWAHLVKYGRIVVAKKGKVILNAPIQEWALWAKMAEDDKSTNGRVIVHQNGIKIAVLRKSFVPDNPWQRLVKRFKRTPAPSAANAGGPQVREGVWSAEDHTAKAA